MWNKKSQPDRNESTLSCSPYVISIAEAAQHRPDQVQKSGRLLTRIRRCQCGHWCWHERYPTRSYGPASENVRKQWDIVKAAIEKKNAHSFSNTQLHAPVPVFRGLLHRQQATLRFQDDPHKRPKSTRWARSVSIDWNKYANKVEQNNGHYDTVKRKKKKMLYKNDIQIKCTHARRGVCSCAGS